MTLRVESNVEKWPTMTPMIFFLNFEGMAIRTRADIEHIREAVEARLEPIGNKVAAVVNYDNFSISPELLDAYVEMVRTLVERYYVDVTRYTTSAFTRARLGAALEGKNLAPQLYESSEQALVGLKLPRLDEPAVRAT